MMLLLFATAVLASHPEVSLPGSDFEIDTNANLKGTKPPRPKTGPTSRRAAAPARAPKADKPTGSGDDSFGQGSKEDTRSRQS